MSVEVGNKIIPVIGVPTPPNLPKIPKKKNVNPTPQLIRSPVKTAPKNVQNAPKNQNPPQQKKSRRQKKGKNKMEEMQNSGQQKQIEIAKSAAELDPNLVQPTILPENEKIGFVQKAEKELTELERKALRVYYKKVIDGLDKATTSNKQRKRYGYQQKLIWLLNKEKMMETTKIAEIEREFEEILKREKQEIELKKMQTKNQPQNPPKVSKPPKQKVTPKPLMDIYVDKVVEKPKKTTYYEEEKRDYHSSSGGYSGGYQYLDDNWINADKPWRSFQTSSSSTFSTSSSFRNPPTASFSSSPLKSSYGTSSTFQQPTSSISLMSSSAIQNPTMPASYPTSFADPNLSAYSTSSGLQNPTMAPSYPTSSGVQISSSYPTSSQLQNPSMASSYQDPSFMTSSSLPSSYRAYPQVTPTSSFDPMPMSFNTPPPAFNSSTYSNPSFLSTVTQAPPPVTGYESLYRQQFPSPHDPSSATQNPHNLQYMNPEAPPTFSAPFEPANLEVSEAELARQKRLVEIEQELQMIHEKKRQIQMEAEIRDRELELAHRQQLIQYREMEIRDREMASRHHHYDDRQYSPDHYNDEYSSYSPPRRQDPSSSHHRSSSEYDHHHPHRQQNRNSSSSKSTNSSRQIKSSGDTAAAAATRRHGSNEMKQRGGGREASNSLKRQADAGPSNSSNNNNSNRSGRIQPAKKPKWMKRQDAANKKQSTASHEDIPMQEISDDEH